MFVSLNNQAQFCMPPLSICMPSLKKYTFNLVGCNRPILKKGNRFITICVHNDYLTEMFLSCTLTFVEVGCMYIISINQRIKKIKRIKLFDYFDFLIN